MRGAAPTGAQAPGRAGLGLTLEREFSLPPPPVQLWLGPDTASYGLLFADWAAKASDFSFRDSESAFAFGVGAGVRGRAGDLQAFLGIEPVGGGAVPRLGARFSSGF
ncbi:MAG: hypothetical protein IMX02_05280 [Limnochordaceae bacterium]|nr:hypothetical protein [Limnochordaceae bacterium]